MLSSLVTLLALAGAGSLVDARPAPKVPAYVHAPHRHWHRNNDGGATAKAIPPKTTAPYKNIFKSLSNDEAASVIGFLHAQDSLNLTASDDAGSWDNSIMVVDLYAPNKTDALPYLQGEGDAPARWAVASLSFGATEEPYIQEWVVGPLPLDESAIFFPDTFSHHGEEAKIRIYDMDDSSGFAYAQAFEMQDILHDLLETNFTTMEEFEEEFAVWGIDPLWREPDEQGNERIIYWTQIWRNGNGTGGDTLLPQGVYMRNDITGRDESKWAMTHILYADEIYSSIDEFRAAWQSPDFKKMTVNKLGDWIDVKHTGEDLPLESMAPPQEVLASGQRFKVDEEEKYVEWMDFTFFITFTRDTGMRLYDIKYKGERIIYELGLQEAIAHYAGNDPHQSGTAYLDTYYGFGPFCFNQVPGYDFPLEGYCMSTAWHANELSKDRHCGITIFEEEQPYLMQRHTSEEYVHTTKNIALTVRSISTVGNYDYGFDYVFYMDGSIETIVRASGYIQSAFYANNTDYGYQIHDALSGSMHDHSLQFKADLDIAGTANTMVKHEFVPMDMKYKWSNVTRSTMKLARTEVATEDEGKMNWAHNSAEQVLIVNKDELNKYGEEKGYKIMPSRGPPGFHLTIANSTNLMKSGSIGTHAYFVTKQKDDEKRSVSAWNAYDPGHPLIDFDQFFDGESLDQEDLVLWFNLGMHHVPHTGDLPNTVFTTAQAGMWITPHNYLLSDPSRQSKQMIHISLGEEGIAEDVNTYGAEAVGGSVDLAQVEWDPYSYTGDIAIRKFPYDPQNPFNDTVAIG